MADETVASFPTYADLTQTTGWAETATAALAVDDTIELAGSRYEERALLGAGGMGKVTLARDARIGREVAVKQLHQERELTPEERARFLREARVQGQLEHPSIVPVYDIDRRADGTTFFTMRRVVGRTLHAILEELRAGSTRHTQRELLTAFATVCLTIDYAHTRGVIHRDLKPANIMLGDFGEVYVLDWGLARIVEETGPSAVDEPAERLSITGALMGTPLYMAPEQMADPRVGAAADVFALGAILFEILTLDRLRDAKTLYLPAEARPSVRAPHRNVAPELEAICVRATETDPKDRIASARELQEAVARFLEGDRDKAQREKVAADRARNAAAVLDAARSQSDAEYERARTIALRELGRAVALDPNNADYGRAFAQIWSTPPRSTPRAVEEELEQMERVVIKRGTDAAVWASLAWFAFIPLAYMMGIRRWDQIALIFVPNTIAVILAVIASRRRGDVPPWNQVAIVVATMLAMAAVSRSWGPLVLSPLMVTIFIIVMQTHPRRWFRRTCFALGMVTMLAPAFLELAGILPSSYEFTGGRMQILPQVIELPKAETFGFLLAAYAVSLFVPGYFIGRMRDALNDAQRELIKKEWHYKRLGGELITTAGHDDAVRV